MISKQKSLETGTLIAKEVTPDIKENGTKLLEDLKGVVTWISVLWNDLGPLNVGSNVTRGKTFISQTFLIITITWEGY